MEACPVRQDAGKNLSKLLIFMSILGRLLVITDRADCGGFL
jgi:hypothetical protein